MSANILFFSNRCDGSSALLSLLHGENLTKYFHLICTDNNNKIPAEIKVTPTLIIKGIQTPYVAGDAFVWFSKIKQWKIQAMMQRMSDTQKQYLQNNQINQLNQPNQPNQPNQLNQSDQTNLLGFNKIEMEGMSDMFAFITEDNIPHAHFDYTNIGKDNIEYYGNESTDKVKINEKTQKAKATALESERKKQDQLIKQQIDNFKNQYTR